MKLGLGCVQFGMKYGISNTQGEWSENQISEVLESAEKNNVVFLDTASSYGQSESRLGKLLRSPHRFKIITKGPSNDLIRSFHQSLERLGQTRVYAYLIHDSENLSRNGGAVLFNRLRELKDRGLVEKIGVSVYDSTQIDRVLELSPIDIIQVPVSILDQRLLKTGYLKKLKNLGIEVHARSAFLQGALLMDPNQLPKPLAGIREHLLRLNQKAKESGLSMDRLALSFLDAIPEIDKIIVGFASVHEFLEVLNLFQQTEDKLQDILHIGQFAGVDDNNILNPGLWSKNA